MNERLKSKLLMSDENADVGRFTYGTPKYIRFPSSGKATIGSFCSIADNVTLIMGGEHIASRVTTYPLNLLFDKSDLHWHETSKGQIEIGNDVWIGYGATILSGTQIGNGAVIGAGSVVSGCVPAYAVMAGNRATILRMRFDNDTIERLEYHKWWDWPLDHIESHAATLLKSPYE